MFVLRSLLFALESLRAAAAAKGRLRCAYFLHLLPLMRETGVAAVTISAGHARGRAD